MMFPKQNKNVESLQSKLFGHRLKGGQTKYEYLIEFLLVATSPKGPQYGQQDFLYEGMFPMDASIDDRNITYYPKNHMGLRRFIFMPKSKLEGKAQVDKDAYRACVEALQEKTDSATYGNEGLAVLQNLLNGFVATSQGRSWFDQSTLPICQELILPEAMGDKKNREPTGKTKNPLQFEIGEARIDQDFEYKKYTYMARGGEIYYLHVLHALQANPAHQPVIEKQLRKMIDSFPQFSYLCHFIQNTWDAYMCVPFENAPAKPLFKELSAIPTTFSPRDAYTASELHHFLSSKAHPFEKMETLANGILLQLLRVMYVAAQTETQRNCWVIDVNQAGCTNVEMKKCAIANFQKNEEAIQQYLYAGYEIHKDGFKKPENRVIRDASEDTYLLFRKLGKTIGIIIPMTGVGMRFTLSEEAIRFLVLAMIPPKGMVTLDQFLDCLYEQYGMIIGPTQYGKEMRAGYLPKLGDLSFLMDNKHAFAQKLKDCGFLRDLSDATAIVENPYECEV